MTEAATRKNGSTDRSKNAIATLQARINAFEQEARGRLVRAIGAADEKLHGLDDALARVSRDDWTANAMRRRIEDLRTRAEKLRADALKRVAEIPADAVTALAGGSRVRVQNPAKGLERIAKRLEVPAATPPSAPPSANA